MNSNAQRAQAVTTGLERIRVLVGDDDVSRDVLDEVLSEMKVLAAKRELWNQADYPAPEVGERQARYLISEDDGKQLALYLNVMRPGKRVPPHNHTTWACIAAVAGEEHNYIYERVDDGSVPGRAQIQQVDTRVIGPGNGIALLGDDIHSVEIHGKSPIRHLHLYGHSLETLTERLTFDEQEGTCKVKGIGVQTRR